MGILKFEIFFENFELAAFEHLKVRPLYVYFI